jgi:hypothetical protein
MSGALPEIYWFLFWVGVLAFLIVFSFSMMTLIHRANMKSLELLRLYAEKGIDPPPAMAELLAKTGGEPDRKWKSTRRGAMLQSFIGFVFTACMAGGIAWWRIDAGGPQAVIYIFGASTVFFGVSAVGLLVAALFTSDK